MQRFIPIFLILLTGQLLQAQNGDAILGKWLNEDGSQLIEVIKTDSSYVGRIVKLHGDLASFKFDTENDNPELHSRKIIGLKVWYDFEYDASKDMWKDGEIYNFKNGNTYNGKIQVDENELKLTGHYGFFFFLAKTQRWTRVTK